jgi:hypothetical protein
MEVPNSNCISCCNSSLLECSSAVQEVMGPDMSVSGALVEVGDDLGKASK